MLNADFGCTLDLEGVRFPYVAPLLGPVAGRGWRFTDNVAHTPIEYRAIRVDVICRSKRSSVAASGFIYSLSVTRRI